MSKKKLKLESGAQCSVEEVGLNEKIQLLMLYQSERQQRDINFWKQIFMYFNGVICIEVLPLAYSSYFDELPSNLPLFAYQIIGILLSFIELLVIYAYKVRFDCIDRSYKKVMNTIPTELQRESIEQIPSIMNGFVRLSMAAIIGYCMVGVQMFFGCVILLHFLQH